MGFFTIYVTDGLSEAGYERALRAGPTYVSTRRREHQQMLVSAGFQRIEEIDLTAEFLVTALAWLRGRERIRKELMVAEGRDLFEERQRDSELQAEGIEAGLLRRGLFLCK